MHEKLHDTTRKEPYKHKVGFFFFEHCYFFAIFATL